MELYLKAAAGVLIAVILGMAMDKQGKELSLLLSLCVCAMVLTAAVGYLSPVMDFFRKLQAVGNLNGEMMSVLCKAVGVGLLGEIAALVCTDSGNAAMGKALEILSAGVVLWLSIPLLSGLLSLVEEILGEV